MPDFLKVYERESSYFFHKPTSNISARIEKLRYPTILDSRSYPLFLLFVAIAILRICHAWSLWIRIIEVSARFG